mmetsp:Transcript_5243/g.10471  ORF Transcript_5243/g.10471 Transcript_5243/m.10471 type:complete len:211 (-) Transcript_5243:273-905(-)
MAWIFFCPSLLLVLTSRATLAAPAAPSAIWERVIPPLPVCTCTALMKSYSTRALRTGSRSFFSASDAPTGQRTPNLDFLVLTDRLATAPKPTRGLILRPMTQPSSCSSVIDSTITLTLSSSWRLSMLSMTLFSRAYLISGMVLQGESYTMSGPAKPILRLCMTSPMDAHSAPCPSARPIFIIFATGFVFTAVAWCQWGAKADRSFARLAR